jgi:hypothetical protein
MRTPAANECGRVQEGSDAAHGTAPGPQLVPCICREYLGDALKIEENCKALVHNFVPPDAW